MTEKVGRDSSFKDYSSFKGKRCLEVFCFVLPAVIIVIVTVCLLVSKRITDPSYVTHCTMNSTQYMENITGNLLMDKPFANGSLVTVDGMMYPRGYHWSSDGTIWGCPCLLKPCIYKCCDKHESHVYEEYEYYGETVKTTNCENDHVPFSPKKSEIYSVKDVLRQHKVNVDDDHFFVINGDGQCRGRGLFALSDTEKKETYLLEDGRLYSSVLHKHYWNYTEFCVESSINDSVTNHFMICFEEESEESKQEKSLDWQFIIRGVGMLVSVPCLIITLVVYAILPLLNNLHGKSLKYYVFCLTVAYCCLGFLQIFVINMPKSLCSTLVHQQLLKMTENVGRTTSFKDSIKGKQCFEVFCFILPAVIIVIVTVCLLVLKRIADPLCTMNSTQYMENITGNLLMDKPFANGSLVTVDGMTYPRGYHWSSDGTIWGCPCLLKPCIYKCCDKHESHVYEEYEYYGETVKTTNCENDHVPFSPKKSEIYSVKDVLRQHKVNVDDDHFFVINGDGQCRGRGLFALSDTEKKETYLLEDGRLYSSALHKPYWNYTEFCVESLNDRVTNHFMICFEEESFDFKHEEGLDWHFIFRVVGMVVSLPCLIITLVVYAMLPLLNNLHGKSLKYYVFCLTVAYCCLGFLQIFVINMPKSLCSALGFVIQFTVLTSFFWLNVMCFDIWWVFSGLMPLRGSQQATEQFKFRMYSLYAWGCPSVILIISLIMEYAPGIPHNAIKPEMGITKCFFKGNDAKLLYFYLPIGVLVYLNVVMFVTTALRFKSHSKSVKKLQRGDSRRHCQAGDSTTDMQRFSLYLKLFVVMGISWVLELITYFVQSDSIFFLLMDLSNGLQGVFILYIFVWKRPILTQLKERLNSRSFFSTYSSDKTVNCSGTDSTGSAMIPSVHRKISEQSTTSSCDTSV